MKINNIFLIAMAAFIVAAADSCKKDLIKANTNPDAITGDKVDPNLLLTTVQLAYTGAPTEGGSVWVTKWGGVGCFIQHVASTNPGFYYGDKYLNNVFSLGETFQDNYGIAIQPAVELYQLTANKAQYRNLHQMARIMKAMIFEQLTDLYGDIPYFQAGLGYYDRIYTPVYDKQQVIYTDLLKEVLQATDSLDEDADKPAGDILYSQAGDQIAEWKMFGNSLLLRMAMRLTKVDLATAQKYVALAAGKTMQSNDDNAIVQHLLSANALTSNQDAQQILSQDSTDLRLSDTLIGNMKKFNDPRLPVVAFLYRAKIVDGVAVPLPPDDNPADQRGLPPGFIIGGANPIYDLSKPSTPANPHPPYPHNGLFDYSSINDNLLSINSPSLILTYAETELLLAEAELRWPGISKGLAADHFTNGVTAAIDQMSAYGASIDGTDYANANTLDPNPATAYEQINTQYWLCTLMDEYEAYANYRRSGYPVLVPTHYPGNVTGGTIPHRLTYPPSQKVTNLANYNKAVANLTGGDRMTSRVWWDIDISK